MARGIRDVLWIRQAFILPEKTIQETDMARRILTSASLKFTDTTIGGNFAINPPPQFTRYADIKVGGDNNVAYMRGTGERRARNNNGGPQNFNASRGMGRYYSEALDDNGQHVVMRFGVPEFNSLYQFFAGFYDPAASLLARTGRATGLFFEAGRAAGFLIALPFQPFIIGGQVYRFLSRAPASKYYYLKPTMALYWNAVNTLVNGISVNMGITPYALTDSQKKVLPNPEDFNTNDFTRYHDLLPDIISPTGAIDVYAMAGRAQRIANQYNIEVRAAMDSATNPATSGPNSIREKMEEIRRRLMGGEFKEPWIPNSDAYIKAYLDLSTSQPTAKTTIEDGVVTEDGQDVESVGSRGQYDNAAGDKSFSKQFGDFYESERRDGGDFVTFRVDYSGAASESFSNEAQESGLAQQMNSTSSSARMARFNIAEGNLGDGIVASVVEGTFEAAKNLLSGVATGLQLSGLAALAGSAFVDIPKTWSGSTANLPRADYTIELRSPYGNKLSRLRNLIIPLSMLLAGVLPLSAGKRAYTSPFICELYCRGRTAIRLGMIDSLTVTRGAGNVGWTQEGEPLGIDISFSVVDFSSVMHMPISANFGAGSSLVVAAGDAVAGEAGQSVAAGLVPSSYDDDNAFTDYMAVLGSLSFADMVFANRRWKLNRMRAMRAYQAWTSPAHLASWANGTFPGRLINAISLDTDRP